ncbi:MAG: arsenate reductase ArsC [Burkholderiales bacterium]
MLLSTPSNQTDSTVVKPDLVVLVLCTGNSARSIMAEALFNHLGNPRIRAFSAGSKPVGRVNPYALEQIRERLGDEGSVYESKSWDKFSDSQSSQAIDIVLTVCGNAANEACPAFPGDAIHLHWDFADPAAASGSAADIQSAFAATFLEMQARIELLMRLLPNLVTKQEVSNALLELSYSGNAC